MRIYWLCLAICLSSSTLFAQSLLKTSDREWRDRHESLLLDEFQEFPFVGFRPNAFEDTFFDFSKAPIAAKVSANFASFRENGIRLYGLGSSQWPVITRTQTENAQGFDGPEKENIFGKASVAYKPTDWVFMTGSAYGGARVNSSNFWYHFEQGYSELRLRKFVLAVGRKPFFWGQSFVAPLLISDNATNLNSISISTLPQRWPWLFKYFGQMKTELFFSKMNSDRVNPRDYFFGWRLGMTPGDFMELNIALIYQFGGKNISNDGPWTDIFLEILGARGSRSNAPDDSSNVTNRAVQMDYRFWFRDLNWPISYYGEHHLEDCCGQFQPLLKHAYSYMHGVLLKSSKGASAHHLRLEYIRTGTKTYFHGTWPSGFSNEAKVLGNPLGPDAQGAFFRWDKRIYQKAYLEALWFWQRRNRSENIDRHDIHGFYPQFQTGEQRVGFVPRFMKDFSNDWRFELSSSLVRVFSRESQKDRNSWQWGIFTGVQKTL